MMTVEVIMNIMISSIMMMMMVMMTMTVVLE